MGSILYILNVAQSARLVSTTKVEVQSEVRRAMDWIVNDVRQTVNSSIGLGSNLPSSTHIKFGKVTGYGTPLSNPVEYIYDSGAQTITRFDASVNPGSWVFRNIVSNDSPFNAGIFYTRLADGSIIIIDPQTTVDSPVFQTGNLVVVITGRKQVNAGLDVSYTLRQEVKIRNN